MHLPVDSFFFFNDTATTEIYTLSLHDALPISARPPGVGDGGRPCRRDAARQESARERGAVRAAAGDRAHARGREELDRRGIGGRRAGRAGRTARGAGGGGRGGAGVNT